MDLAVTANALWETSSPYVPCRDLVKMVYNNVDRVPGKYGPKYVVPPAGQRGVIVAKTGGGGAAAAASRGRRGGQWRFGEATPALLFTQVPQRGAGFD